MKSKPLNETGKVQEMKTNLLFIITVSIFTLVSCNSSFASSVLLQWDPNTELDLAGYKVYYKADSSVMPFDGIGATEGAAPIDVRNLTKTTINGLDPSRAYNFAITAYNRAGIESSYSNIVTVPESMPPSAAITSPSNTSSVTGIVSVTATASDNVGVTKVEFYLDGVLQFTDTSTPYLFSWNTSSLTGNHSLLVKAYDAAGNVGQSSAVLVTVIKDTTVPTVSITTPVKGATLRGTVAMNVTASDNVGVTRVEFFVNGVLKAAMNTSPYTFNWNTSPETNGSYTLTAKAYDNAGNIGQASSVIVTVLNDSTPPVVAISSPVTGAKVSGTVALSATASDNVAVSRVEFYQNGKLLASSSSAPYRFNWNSTVVANGSYIFTAKAYDSSGNIGQSTNVNLTVYNPVADVTPPTITFISPSTNYSYGPDISISATATDNIAVTKMELYIDNILQMSTITSAISTSVSITTGLHTITVKAYDAANNVTSSSTSVNRFF